MAKSNTSDTTPDTSNQSQGSSSSSSNEEKLTPRNHLESIQGDIRAIREELETNFGTGFVEGHITSSLQAAETGIAQLVRNLAIDAEMEAKAAEAKAQTEQRNRAVGAS